MNNSPNIQSALQFKGYRVSSIDFACPTSFKPDKIENGEYKFNFGKRIQQLDAENFQTELSTNLFFGKDINPEEAEFHLSITVIGFFCAKPKFDSKWEKNALSILFPYVRAIISMITSQTGRDPIILPTINITRLFEEAVSTKELKEDNE